MMQPTNSSPELMSYRLGEVERGVKELRGELNEAVGQLGGGMTALQTQLAAYQNNISEKYVSRREFDELQNRVDKQSEWGWKIATISISAASAVFTAIGWLRPFH